MRNVSKSIEPRLQCLIDELACSSSNPPLSDGKQRELDSTTVSRYDRQLYLRKYLAVSVFRRSKPYWATSTHAANEIVFD